MENNQLESINTIESINKIETIESIEKMNTSNYFDYQTLLSDHCMIYSIFFTTIFTIGWIYKEKPKTKRVLISYPISLFLRYKFYGFYLWMDSIQIGCYILSCFDENKIKII